MAVLLRTQRLAVSLRAQNLRTPAVSDTVARTEDPGYRGADSQTDPIPVLAPEVLGTGGIRHQKYPAPEVFDIRSIVHRKYLANVALPTAIFIVGQIPWWSDVSTTGHRDADRQR